MASDQTIQKAVLLLCIGVPLFFNHGVEGRKVLSMEEDLELEKELKLLNRTPVKTIQTEGGDVFDCVDIYKQPAFDHPLLKNHKIQMRPGSYPSSKIDKKPTEEDAMQIELPKVLCPPGTVPIRRISKQDLIRIKAHSKREANHVRRKYSSDIDTDHYWAILRANEGVYFGARAHLNVYALPQVLPGQYSASEIFVTNGFSGSNDSYMNTVQAGWTVHPHLFGDTKTRLFVYWTGDGYDNTGCYNLLCPGFVQTSNVVPLGAQIDPLSTYGGQQYEISLTIYKDPTTLQWWLLYHNEFVGYWPNALFNSLRHNASEVYWGGTVLTPSDVKSPPMGSGHFANEGFGKAALVGNVMLVDNTNTFYDPVKDDVYNFVTDDGCYNLGKNGYKNAQLRYGFFFGGPGGCIGT